MRMFTLTVAAIVWAVLPPLAQEADAQARAKLTIGTLAAHDFDPAYVALDKGFFTARGLDATIVRITSVGNVPPAIFSGSVDIAPTSPVALLQGAEAGLNLVAVSGAVRARPGSTDSSLIALRTSNLHDPGDLAGKKVGVSALNSFWNLMAEKWLTLHKVSPDRVTWVEVTLPNMRDALKTHGVDAVTAVEPFRSNMLTDPAFVSVSEYPAEVNPTVVESIWLASSDWALAHKPEVAGFRAAMDDARAFILAHPDEARTVISKHWNVPPTTFPEYMGPLEPADFSFFISLTKEFGVVTSPPDISNLILPN